MTTEDALIGEDVTTTPIIFRDNCSVYNPCGRYGYCHNNLNGEWKCLCKFWWNGTMCNELTESGKQIIALGVMLGVLIAAFYGLILFHYIRNRRKVEKNDQKQNIPIINRKFSTIPTTDLDPHRRILSCITGIATIIVAVSTLIVKWVILKPIHEEIVDKFNNNQSLFYKQHSICKIIYLRAEFNLFTFPAACLLILLFTITTRRVVFQRNKLCKGYFGIPIPLDFFGHVKRTLAAVIFAIFAEELFGIANEILSGKAQSSNKGVIVTYLLQIFRVIVIGFRRYPVLAAVYIDTYFSLICATLYIWFDFGVNIVYTGLCRNDFYQTEEQFNQSESSRTFLYLTYYGTGSKLLFFQLFNDIPRYLCMAYISVKLPRLLFKRIRYRHIAERQLTREQKDLLVSSLPNSAESRYVKKLLGMNSTPPPTNRFFRIVRVIYAWRDDFRFSSRVVCTYASIFLLLFFLTVKFCVEIPPRLADLHEDAQLFADFVSSRLYPPDPDLLYDEDSPSNFPLPDFVRPYLIGVNIALVIIVAQLLNMLACIRRNLLQAFRGNNSELPRRTKSRNLSYIIGNFHFAGYLIGYVIISYVLLIFFAVLIALGIDAFITYGSVRALEGILILIIPYGLFLQFKLYLNKFLAKYVFVQYGGEVLSTNNRRAFMVFIYFNFFLDAFLGLIAALMRLLKSAVGGVVYMCRLDYSPLGRKLETMDAGFNAYCGLIYMEFAHRHPVVLCFVSHLLRDYLYPTRTKRLSKAKHQWYLAVFLLKNPTLIYQRKEFLADSKANQMKIMLIGRKNMSKMYNEQPSMITQRESIITEREAEEWWQQGKF